MDMTVTPSELVRKLAERLEPVDCEYVAWHQASGLVTGENLVADRDSPASDVSAMDGYAMRMEDLEKDKVRVGMDVLPGREAGVLAAGEAARIMTGAVVPEIGEGAEVVVMREDVDVDGEWVSVRKGLEIAEGANIRRRGENGKAGDVVVEAGRVIEPAVMTATASFGCSSVCVRREVRVSIVTTGDELLPPDARVEDWQIRDSNGPALRALVEVIPGVRLVDHVHAMDEYEQLVDVIGGRLACSDVVFMTGGVSMGTHDFVPRALEELGCEILFHRVPIRPGKPLLAAVGPEGQAVMGLPGNPMSVMVTARRFGMAAIRRKMGLAEVEKKRGVVELEKSDGKSLGLWWYRPVKLTGDGRARLMKSKGSGDLISVARSDGFVEIEMGGKGVGPWPYYEWCG